MFVNESNIESVRSRMCRRRRALGIGAQYFAAHRLYQQLQLHPLFQGSQHVACYWAIEGELSCQWVIKALWRSGKRCYLPVIDFSTNPQSMGFRECRPGDRLLPNRYGIPESVSGRYCQAWQLDCALIPLTVFDKDHHRIGMGGGFYDRAFEHAHRPALVGVAHCFQEVVRIEPQPWDVVLDDVITV